MKLFWAACLFLFVSRLEAQVQVLHKPLFMGLYAQTPALYNPAMAGQRNRYEGWTGLQRWPLLSYLTAHLNFRLSASKMHTSASVLGLSLSNEREGSFLDRSTAYLLYTRHQRLNRSLYLSAALQLGLASYLVGQSQNRAGYSDNVWDGGLGLALWGEDFTIGLAMLYAFDSELRPAGSVEILRLARHFNFHLSKTHQVNPDFELETQALFRQGPRWSSFGFSPDLSVSIFAVLQKKIKVGFSYLHNSGLTFGAGLHEINLSNLPTMSLTLGYTQPFDRSQLRSINRYEVVLRVGQKLLGQVNSK
jgi:hypothetical protein